MTILLLILLFVMAISSIWTYNEEIEGESSNDSNTNSPDKTSSFNFNYSKTGSTFGQQNIISYNSTTNILAVTSNEMGNINEKPLYAIKLLEANESKLRDIFINNEFFATSGNLSFNPDYTIYSLNVEMDDKIHTANWTNTLPKVAPEHLVKIKDAVVDFVCRSSTNPIACETVMLEFR
jgi:hypothetical protein